MSAEEIRNQSEEETVESVETHTAITLSPCSYGLSLV